MYEIVQKTIVGVFKNPESQFVFCNKNIKPYGNARKSFFTANKKEDIINSCFLVGDVRIGFKYSKRAIGHKSIEITLRDNNRNQERISVLENLENQVVK
jgi:hypothetical protein